MTQKIMNRIKEKFDLRWKDILICYAIYLSCAIMISGMNSDSYYINFILINIIIYSLPFFLLLLITGRTSPTLVISLGSLFVLYYINEWVYDARHEYIEVKDLRLAKEAINVADHYKPVWNEDIKFNLILILLVVGLYVLLKFFLKIKIDPKAYRKAALIGLIISIVLNSAMLVMVNTKKSAITMFNDFNHSDAVNEMGLICSLVLQNERMTSKTKLPGYTKEKAKEVLDRYQSDDAAQIDDKDKFNIVVIMNESLSDYSLLGQTSFKNPMPEISKMVKEGSLFEGKMYVPVYGGGTGYTEWEFLTGSTSFFKDTLSVPLVYEMTKDTNHIGKDLEEMDYSTSFLHLYKASGWDRRNVYNKIGFDQAVFGDDLSGQVVEDNARNTGDYPLNYYTFGAGHDYIRGFISDRENYRELDSLIDWTDGNASDFVYCVTIQNHGAYLYNYNYPERTDFRSDKYVEILETDDDKEKAQKEVSEINEFLTIMSLSDSAFVEYINELSEKEEKTLVFMFGDHQPYLSIDKYIEYDDSYNQDLLEMNYVTPYYVWSNFDLDYEFPEKMSSNYISSIIKDCLALPMTALDKYRIDTFKEYPVMSSDFVIDSNGDYHTEADTDTLKNYGYVQYYINYDLNK